MKRFASEFIGTALLLVAVVGSGIMGDRLSAGNMALALLANSIATGAALIVLILIFSETSGAHFNPVVTLVLGFENKMPRSQIIGYITFQVLGAIVGVWMAHAMFSESIMSVSHRERQGYGQIFGEFIATFGLLSTIFGCSRSHPRFLPVAIGLYITAAYWFTSSTSFANPAVTLARGFTDTFTGIRPLDIPGFVVAQIMGGVTAAFFFRWLFAKR